MTDALNTAPIAPTRRAADLERVKTLLNEAVSDPDQWLRIVTAVIDYGKSCAFGAIDGMVERMGRGEIEARAEGGPG